MSSFHLEIVTPQRLAFAEDVDSVYVPTSSGTIGVLAHHTALFTSLTEGEVKINQGNKQYFLAIGGGFMEVTKNKVSILVSRAVHADELNVTEIEKAEREARDVIKNLPKGAELSQAQSILRRSILELKVARRRRNRPLSSELTS